MLAAGTAVQGAASSVPLQAKLSTPPVFRISSLSTMVRVIPLLNLSVMTGGETRSGSQLENPGSLVSNGPSEVSKLASIRQ